MWAWLPTLCTSGKACLRLPAVACDHARTVRSELAASRASQGGRSSGPFGGASGSTMSMPSQPRCARPAADSKLRTTATALIASRLFFPFRAAAHGKRSDSSRQVHDTRSFRQLSPQQHTSVHKTIHGRWLHRSLSTRA